MVFSTMEARFPRLWPDSFNGQSRDAVKAQWVNDLQGYTLNEIRKALDASKAFEFPPNIGKFIQLARDYEAEYMEAVKQMNSRHYGKDEWPYAALYWAANAMTFEMRNYSYNQVKRTWHLMLDEAIAKVGRGLLPNEVPARLISLPKQPTLTQIQQQDKLSEFKREMGWV